MAFDAVWQELRDQCRALGPDTVLVTPSSERAFDVRVPGDDRLVARFRETDEEHTLWRDQFEVLYDRLETESGELALEDLPAGVEPYVSVVSLGSRYVVDGDVVRRGDADGSENPLRRPEWTVRTRPERVRDDAVLLTDLLDRHVDEDLDSLDPESLVDLYVLLSDVQRGADGLRSAVGEQVLEHVGPSGRFHGRFGTVTRTTRERRRRKDDETVLDALDEAGIPREWVLGVDPEKLDVVLAATDLEEADVYDVEEQVYAQKTSVEEAEKQSRLQGLRDRLAGLDTEEAAELRDDIDDLEDRLDTVLAVG